MKNATASPAYSAEQMQDIRRRLLRAEEQRDAKAAALDALVEAVRVALDEHRLDGFGGPVRVVLGNAVNAAKLAQVAK